MVWGRGGMVAGGFDTDDGSLVTRLRKMGRFQKTRGDRVSVMNLNFREKQASLLLEHLNIFSRFLKDLFPSFIKEHVAHSIPHIFL